MQEALCDALFSAIVTHAGVGLAATTPDGAIVHANQALQALLGYTQAELIGRHYNDFAHPADAASDAEIRRQLLSGERDSFAAARRYLTRSGDLIWTDLTVRAVRGEAGRVRWVVATVEDRTERVRAEEALRAGEERFRVAAESAHDLVYEWELASDELSLFGSMALGAIPDSARPASRAAWEARLHPDDRPRVLAALQAHLDTGEPFAEEYRYEDAGGSWRRWIDRGRVLFDATGEPRRMIGAWTDVTDRRHLEERLAQSQKMEAVGQLAGGVAHDFNNLLFAILASIDYALDAIEPGPARRDLLDARAAAERGSGLTKQLLALSRRQVLRAEPLSLNTVIVGLMRMLRRAIGPHVRFVFKPGGDLGTIRADKGQLEQILINLCLNARDAMADGGRLTIATGNRRLSEDNQLGLPAGRYVRLDVGDTGTGIAPEIMPRIFDPFFTTKREGRGTGLGLPTVYGIVVQHQGAIDVDTSPEGTTFRVYFPVLEYRPQRIATTSDQQDPETYRGSETVLVAEDNPQVRALTQRVLGQAGYRVLVASDGVEACELFEAFRDEIALVLLDVVMPRMGGRTAHARMRALAPHARFAFVSGYSTDVLDAEFLEAHDLRLMAKPYRRSQLLRFVREEIDRVVEAPPGPAG